MDGGNGNNNGYIGVGNDLPGNFIPQARMHLHQTGGAVGIRFSNNSTGLNASDGAAITMEPLGGMSFTTYELNQNFSWYTQGNGGTGLFARMRLFDGGTGTNTGQLAISDNLPATFVTYDRVHLYQTSGNNAIRYSTNTFFFISPGSLYDSPDLLLSAVTGKPLDPQIYLTYLKTKYSALYDLK